MLASLALNRAASFASSCSPMLSSTSMASSLGRPEVETPRVPPNGGSTSSSKSFIFTIHRIISPLWNLAYILTTRPRTKRSLKNRPSRIWVTHSWLVLGPPPCPPPCSNKRDASSSCSRWSSDHLSACEFSRLNHLSPGLSPPPPGKLISSASFLK